MIFLAIYVYIRFIDFVSDDSFPHNIILFKNQSEKFLIYLLIMQRSI